MIMLTLNAGWSSEIFLPFKDSIANAAEDALSYFAYAKPLDSPVFLSLIILQYFLIVKSILQNDINAAWLLEYRILKMSIGFKLRFKLLLSGTFAAYNKNAGVWWVIVRVSLAVVSI